MVKVKPLVAGMARNDNTRLAALLARAHLAMIRGFSHIVANPNSKVIFATAVGPVSFENIATVKPVERIRPRSYPKSLLR
jgi:hypothetical protein